MQQLQGGNWDNLPTEERELLAQLGVTNPIELALFRPKEYRDFNLYLLPIEGPQLFEGVVLSVQKHPKVVKVRFHLLNLKRIVEGIFFKVPKWQWRYFRPGKRLYLWGELKEGQILHPWILSRPKGIEPVYPPLPIPVEKYRQLLEKLATPTRLYPLPEEIGEGLYRSHFPRERSDIYPARLERVYKWAEIFNYLYRLRQRRVYRPAPVADRDPTPFIRALPFKLTGDQLRALNQVRADLRSPYQRRRVIIGDVGSGKTIIMLGIAYIAQKSAIMCPTSILAEQIYREAVKFLKPLGMEVVLVTQRNKISQRELERGDLLIGTHALLHRPLPKLNAISIDEQHKFGTAQRQRLEQLTGGDGLWPHHFQFSATPIPRTQALIYSSFVEVTLIKELPFKKEIETRILPKSLEGVQELVALLKRELDRGKQGVIVYPAVSEEAEIASLERGRKFWEKYFNKVFVTFGRDRKKEEVLRQFREEGGLLVTTTIVEVGISLPELSVIVIIDPDRMGLATLHQLRGRVGRYGEKGYCLLVTDKPENPRLREFAQILDGFKIAELDLKYRKAGDLLKGSNQSGATFRYFDEVEDLEILEEAKNYLDQLEEPLQCLSTPKSLFPEVETLKPIPPTPTTPPILESSPHSSSPIPKKAGNDGTLEPNLFSFAEQKCDS
ncbi:MAG: ATP-dependent DNA helicase RecG [Campylobacterales bacterium]